MCNFLSIVKWLILFCSLNWHQENCESISIDHHIYIYIQLFRIQPVNSFISAKYVRINRLGIYHLGRMLKF